MADVTIEAALIASVPSTRWIHNRVWTTKDIGYEFFIDAAASPDLVYRKTTDGGATWGSPVVVYASTGNLEAFDVWYAKWTEGDSSTLIHIAWIDGGDQCRHRTLDTASDTLGTTVNIQAVAVAGGTGFQHHLVAITKAKGGNLYVMFKHYTGSPAAGTFERSTDGGATWTARTLTLENGDDEFLLLPSDGTGDNNDIFCLYGDVSANTLAIRMFDESTNLWTITALATYIEAGADYLNFDAMLSHSGKIYAAFCNAHNTTTADLEVWEIMPNSIAAPGKTQKTNVLTDTQAVVSPRVLIDDVSGHLYVGYLRGTLGSSMQEYYKKSTDMGGTWGSEIQFAESAAGPLRNLFSPRLIRTGDTGRIAWSWTHNTNADLITNKVNSIEIGAAAGGQAPRSMHQYRLRRAA